MFIWMEEYLKHSALNFGQVLHGLRFFLSHPTADRLAPRGTFRHAVHSLRIRSARLGNDLFFALIPPHWHHTRAELEGMSRTPLKRWLEYGYRPWRFTEAGELREDLPNVDKRWDPRCDD